MTKYNLDKLVKVRVNDFYRTPWYKYNDKPKKYFWHIKKGFYHDCFGIHYVGHETPKNHKLKNGIVYENPNVVMTFQGGVTTKKYFLTLDEALAYVESITKGKNWLLN